MSEESRDMVHHPAHYGGGDNPYEVIKVLEATLSHEQFLGFCRGNAIKYLMRADKKGHRTQDLAKAAWYTNCEKDFLTRTTKL